MGYRPLVLAAAVAALVTTHVASAQAQPVYVPPGGMYIGPGAGPVYVTPGVPRYGYGYGFVVPYEEPDYGYYSRNGVVVRIRSRRLAVVRIRSRRLIQISVLLMTCVKRKCGSGVFPPPTHRLGQAGPSNSSTPNPMFHQF